MRTSVHPLRQIHRWLAIVVSPLLFLVIVSGMILAFQPILATSSDAGVTPASLLAALQHADPAGMATSLGFVKNGRAFDLSLRSNGVLGSVEGPTGVQTGPAGTDIDAFGLCLLEGLLAHASIFTLISVLPLLGLLVTGLVPSIRRVRVGATSGLPDIKSMAGGI